MGRKTNEKNIKRVYHEQTARLKRVNRYMILGFITLYSILIVNMLLRIREADEHFLLNSIILGVCIFSALVNVFLYKRNPVSEYLRYFMIGVYAIIYSIMIFVIQDFYFVLTFIIALTGTIIYYDSKLINGFTLYMVFINGIRMIYYISIGADSTSAVTVSSLLVVLISAATLYFATHIGGIFTRDMVGAASDEKNNIKQIFTEVMQITSVIQKNVDEISTIINELHTSTDNVNNTTVEIAKSTGVVSHSIIEQTHLTSEILNDMKETEKSSCNVVSTVNESTTSIEKNLQDFKHLKDNAKEIASINENVAATMDELQENAKAVNDIMGVIAGISKQTNLLALNASIEANRAGEAGSGFTIVANEIRTLSAQTRNSTEHITDILNKLNNKAAYASQIVGQSIGVTAKQSDSINQITQSMDKVHSNMNILSDNIIDINEKVVNVSKSNQDIVDNISQISTVCKEITASTENATGVTNKSQQLAQKAVILLNEVIEVSHKLDKYK